MPDRLTPFPWDRLPRMSTAEARIATELARWLTTVDARQATETARSLLGASVGLLGGLSWCARRPSPHAPTLEIVGDAHLWLELPGPLSAWIVDRALGGDATLKRLDAGPFPRNDAARGVLAYVAARILHALPGHHAVNDAHADATQLTALQTEVSIACFALRLTWDGVEVPIHGWLLRAPRIPVRSMHPYLSSVLLHEHVVLSAQLMAQTRIAYASPRTWLVDDVILLTASGLLHGPHGYAGRIQLHVLGARSQRWIGQLEGDRIELQERQTMEHDGLTTGSFLSPHASSETLTRVADAPLEISVEIARFTLPLSEIASLAAGEVLLTGRPVGQHVTLRAGTRAIATGELVNVDGAIGVRILSLAGA